MEQQIEKFLEFNGVIILFVVKNGAYWIALKPICEALNVNYDIQYHNVKESKAFGTDLSDLQMQIPGEKSRTMACIKEISVYGWIFTICNEQPEFIIQQKECNDILFNYFHSTITIRMKLFEEKAKIQVERKHLTAELRSINKFVVLEHLIASEARIGSQLKNMNTNELNQQLELFEGEN